MIAVVSTINIIRCAGVGVLLIVQNMSSMVSAAGNHSEFMLMGL